jgi:hypothetical protein
MNREEKILMAIEKGYTCNPETGEVFGIRGKVIKTKSIYTQISLYCNNKIYRLYAHQFIWYDVHKQVVEQIDHLNGKKHDNRIENLRSVTNQQNQWNKINAKGYYYNKRDKVWQSQIKRDGKTKNLGSFDTEEEARQAYLEAKKIYHII